MPILTKKGQLSAPYINANQQAANLQTFYRLQGINISETGKVLKYETEEFIAKGILDVFAVRNEVEQIRDLKYSAHLENKWDSFGWHIKRVSNDRDKQVQGIHYKYLAYKCLNIFNIPFYFDVHSSTNPIDAKSYELVIDNSDFEGIMEDHENLVKSFQDFLSFSKEFHNFAPRSEYKKCKICPFYNSCNHKKLYPDAESITVRRWQNL